MRVGEREGEREREVVHEQKTKLHSFSILTPEKQHKIYTLNKSRNVRKVFTEKVWVNLTLTSVLCMRAVMLSHSRDGNLGGIQMWLQFSLWLI